MQGLHPFTAPYAEISYIWATWFLLHLIIIIQVQPSEEDAIWNLPWARFFAAAECLSCSVSRKAREREREFLFPLCCCCTGEERARVITSALVDLQVLWFWVFVCAQRWNYSQPRDYNPRRECSYTLCACRSLSALRRPQPCTISEAESAERAVSARLEISLRTHESKEALSRV